MKKKRRGKEAKTAEQACGARGIEAAVPARRTGTVRRGWWWAAAAVLLILVAMLFRALSYVFPSLWMLSVPRGLIYMGLGIGWGISVRRRVIQPQVRKLLTAVAALMVFWFVVRSVKYQFMLPPTAVRCLWYLFYLPMISIPLCALFLAMLLGVSEEAVLPRVYAVPLGGVSMVLFLFVMTNDLHQLVFTFPPGKPWLDADYGYGPVYYFILAWLAGIGFAMLVLLLYKCRIPHSRRFIWLPGVPIVLLLVYTVMYLFRVAWLDVLLGDMTAVFCVAYAAVLESCMQTGLIQTNTGYDLLFEATSLRAQITDDTWHTCYASSSALPPEVLQRAEDAPVHLDRATVLKTSAIRGGHVAWQEDVTELADALDRLEENQRTLKTENRVRQEALAARQEMLRLQEKNRLYAMIERHTRPQVVRLDRLLDDYDAAAGEHSRRRLLEQMCVIGAYVKRCGNLLLIRESGEPASLSELARAMEESLRNLELSGAACGLSCGAETPVSAEAAVEAYDFFECAVETVLGRLDCLWVNLRVRDTALVVHMELETAADLAVLADRAAVRYEDGVWTLTARFAMGGEIS